MDRIHEIHFLKEKPPKGYSWSGVRLIQIQATARPEHVWPEVWTKIGKAVQKREQQELANEKSKLDSARRLRGIYFIDSADEHTKETIKKASRRVEVQGNEKSSKLIVNGSEKSRIWQDFKKTNYACIVEAHEFTRQCSESSLPKHHDDHIADKGCNSMVHYNLVHKFIPMPQALRIPDAKAAVDKEWNKLEALSALNLEKMKI